MTIRLFSIYTLFIIKEHLMHNYNPNNGHIITNNNE